jgi:3-oxoacyl-[acyl-carrier protein] reductase
MRADRVVVVSGGSRGLGAAIVEDQLGSGNVVATFSRAKTPFIEQCLESDFARVNSFLWDSIDGSDARKVDKFVRNVFAQFGKIDVLINNAGVAGSGMFCLANEADIQQTIRVNLELNIHLTRLCAKAMLVAQGGCIVNISSINAVRGHAGVAVYSATKAAVDGMTRSLARELGPSRIRVNSIAPGYFESDMTKEMTKEQLKRIANRTALKRLASMRDIVGVVRFLSSDESTYITGQTIVVDGGATC